MGNYYYSRGQQCPDRKMPAPDMSSGKQASVQPTQNNNPVTAANNKVKPVKASDVAKATIQRADDYVNEKMESVKTIISSIPECVPITISKEVKDLLDQFNANINRLEGALNKFEGIADWIDKMLMKGLLFISFIVIFNGLYMGCTGEKKNEAERRMEEADRRKQEADSLYNRAKDIVGNNDLYRDFGIWMVDRYGDRGSDFTKFQKQYNKANNK